jgi:hypothetical protein
MARHFVAFVPAAVTCLAGKGSRHHYGGRHAKLVGSHAIHQLGTVAQRISHMYPVHLDFVLRYVPPMVDIGHGIRLTRSFELPFPPTEKMLVFSKEWEGQDDPMGYVLKEVTWDIDGACFLAETELSSTGVPIAFIPLDIRRIVDFGWQFGSFKDDYETDRRRVRKRKKLPRLRISGWDDDEVEAWETAAKKTRPKEFAIVLQAVASTMAELHNNSRVAFAMLKTGGYVELPRQTALDQLTAFQRKFAAALDVFDSMSADHQWHWCESVSRRYPRLVDVVEAIR